MKVILVDKGTIGGECLNWGCIPSKALISAANFYHKINADASKMGILVENATLDVKKLQYWKMEVQNKLINGIKQLLRINKVETIIGTANFIDKETVEVITNDQEKLIIQASNIIIATGTSFISLPEIQIDEENILSAKGALSLNDIPNNMLIIGGGVIGIELGTVYAKFGTKVTIVELMKDILPGFEPRITTLVKKRLLKLGAEIFTASKVGSVKNLLSGNLMAEIETENGKFIREFDKILLSIGKKADFSQLKIDRASILTDNKGFIKVNNKQQTNISNIFAIGDCTGIPFTAHKATKQGIIAAEVIAGIASESDFKSLNVSVIFTDPEIATIGLDEKEAEELGITVSSGISQFNTSGRALTYMDPEGFVKVISDQKTGIILGVQIVGQDASNLISEASLALEMGSTVEDLSWTVHPHPTLPEMLMEAADSLMGKAIHQVNVMAKEKEEIQN